MNNNKDKQLLTIKEACELMAMTKSRLYYMIFHKTIPYLKIGASVRFDPVDLEKWIESQKVSSNEISKGCV
jgi:excisionase family DNA binding protein